MLSAFIGKVTGGKGDWRLAPSIALRVNRLIDDLMPLYRASQLENVVQLISSGLDRVDWLDYALHETVLFDARLRGVELEEAVRQLRISLVDLSSPQVRMALQLRLGLMRSHEGEG